MSAWSNLDRAARDHARSWRRALRTARATPPERWVEATAVDPRCPGVDSAYNGLCAASDGRVYFALSTHRADVSAFLGCLDPERQTIEWSAPLSAVVGGDPRDARAHAKVHVPIEEVDGRLYFATIAGDRAPGGPMAFPGFRIMSVDPAGNSWIVHAAGPRGEGVISGCLDARRRVYHALTHPSGLYCRSALDTGHLHVSPLAPGMSPGTRGAPRDPSTPVCRALGLDPDGAIYGSCHDGSIWRCDPDGEPHLMTNANVFDGMVPPVDRRGRASGLWRAIVWDDDGACFYGLHGATGSMFRFSPGADAAWNPSHASGLPHSTGLATHRSARNSDSSCTVVRSSNSRTARRSATATARCPSAACS